jgi:hypothetical protein
MAWKYETVNYASTDHEFSKSVSATSGKKIKAGGYWISGNTNSEVWVRVNGPSTDVSGDGVQWSVQGWFPNPPGSWELTVYVFEE